MFLLQLFVILYLDIQLLTILIRFVFFRNIREENLYKTYNEKGKMIFNKMYINTLILIKDSQEQKHSFKMNMDD